MPWGWEGEFVRMSFTTPSVSFPVLWSFFKTILTASPGEIFRLCLPSRLFSIFLYLSRMYLLSVTPLFAVSGEKSSGIMRCGRYSVLSGRIWIILPILWEEILREFCYGLLIYIVKIIMLINNVCSKLHGVEKSLIGMSVYIVC